MPGLFDSPTFLTPAQRQETIIRKALELRRQFWVHGGREAGYLYRGGGDLLLQHGKFYSGRELPERYRHLRGQPGLCFNNAVAAVEADPTLRYCEGVYSTGGGHYTAHAWCLDPNGELLELTYPTDPEVLAGGVDAYTKQTPPPPSQWGYMGVVFHLDYVRAVDEAQQMNVLDRPSHDVIYAAEFEDSGMDTTSLGETREDFPVFRYPYDPNRRTL